MNDVTHEKVFEGFVHQPGVHCASSALRNVFEHNSIKLSEELIFGIGAGLGIGYLKFPNQNPMIGGRRNGFEKYLAEKFNVALNEYKTKKIEEGWNRLKESLLNKIPQAINIDMAYLPYFDDLPDDYHFGQHVVVVCGYDPEKENVYLTDTDHKDIKKVSVKHLTKGRNSSYNKWMDPYNLIYEYDFSKADFDFNKIIPEAIRYNGKSLLKSGRIMRILGIYGGPKGLEKFSKDLENWTNLSNEDLLKRSKDIVGFISDYGTGRGFFRFLYSRFLKESSEILRDDNLENLSVYYNYLGNLWEDLSAQFKELPTDQSLISNIQENLASIVEKDIEGAKTLSDYKYELY